MELLNLVQLAVDISLTRNNYCEEMNKLRLTLQVFQHTVQQLDDQNCPKQFLQEAEQEIQKTYDWLKSLPNDVNLLDSLKFQIPYNNKVDQIKERCTNIQNLIALSTALNVIVKKAEIKTLCEKKIPQKIVNPTVTQTDDLPEFLDKHNASLELILVGDEKIKNIFRKHGVNLKNQFSLTLKENESQALVCKISRQDYIVLKNDIEQVNTISQDHATIFCKKIKQCQFNENTTSSEENKEIFYSLEDRTEFPQIQFGEKPEIFLEIKGRLGVFLYRKKEKLKVGEQNIQPDTWANRLQNKTIQLLDQDKIALLMQKPDYKTPLIAYEIKINY